MQPVGWSARLRSGIGILLLAGCGLQAADPASAEQWIVVVAPAFREAVEPLCAHRRGQGMQVEIVLADEASATGAANDEAAVGLQGKVRALTQSWSGQSYVLLVGAVSPNGLDDPVGRVVPVGSGRIGRMVGQPTDNAYGWKTDENPRMLPAVAVGRMPARTVKEAQAMVAKTIRGEQPRTGSWKHQITFLAGAPSYYPALDKMCEAMALSTLEKLSPKWQLRGIYCNENSSFTLPDEQVRDRALAYLAEGQTVTIYMGHSNAEGFWFPSGWVPLLSRADFGQVDMSRSVGVFATLGCFGTQLSGRKGEGYGVWAMRNPNGPAAVIGSHGECDAAMSLLMSNGLLATLTADTGGMRVGDLWLSMLKSLAKGPINPILLRLLNEVDGDPNVPNEARRREHLEMYNLLGDPAFKLPAITRRIALEAPATAAPGARVTITAAIPPELADAQGLLTLERAPTDPPAGLKPLPPQGDPGRAKVMLGNHEASNHLVLSSQAIRVEPGEFQLEVEIPTDCAWKRLIVRLYVATESDDGMGVQELRVSSPASKPVNAETLTK